MSHTSFSRAFMLLFLTALLIVIVSCSRVPGSSRSAKRAQQMKEFYLIDSFRSPALSRNTLKQDPAHPISIMLPPSYYAKPGTRYPVLYFLHGYKEVPGMIAVNRKYILKLMKEGTIPEMIVVEPDCTTKYGGGMYVNSPVTGDYEDYLTKELVAFIDANYRTMPAAPSRGISGYSMGGFGALVQGMRHPDVFGVVFAIEPTALAPNGLRDAFLEWSRISDELNAFSSVFSPTPGGTHPGRIPTFDGSKEDNELCALWYAGVGEWDKKIAAYLGLPVRLRALKISYSKNDPFVFTRVGCDYLQSELTAAGVPYDVDRPANSAHVLTLSLVTNDLLPYMGKNLLPAK